MNEHIERDIQKNLQERILMIDFIDFNEDNEIILKVKKLLLKLNNRKKPIDFLLSDVALSFYSCNKILYLLLYYEKKYEAELPKIKGLKLKALNFKLSLIRDKFDNYFYISFLYPIHPRDRDELKKMIKIHKKRI